MEPIDQRISTIVENTLDQVARMNPCKASPLLKSALLEIQGELDQISDPCEDSGFDRWGQEMY